MALLGWCQLSGAFKDLWRSWPQLFLTDLLSRAIVVVALTPVVGFLVNIFLTQVDDGVLADADIPVFFSHPIGIAALVIMGTVALGGLFAEQGVLMVIGYGAAEDRDVKWSSAMRYVGAHALELMKLAGHVFVRLLLMIAPFLAAVGIVYAYFLTQYDINFYLIKKPPEWWWAVALAGLLTAIFAIFVSRAFAGWILALPLVLFQGKPGRQALNESTLKTAPFRWKMSFLIVSWLVGFTLVSILLTFIVSLLGDALIPDLGNSMTRVAVGLVITLLVAGLGNLALAMIGTSVFALWIVRLYRCLIGQGQFQPEVSLRGTLGEKASFAIPGKPIIVICTGIALLVLLAGYFGARSLGGQSQIEIIAHRGASGSAPENTMAAFQRAITEKADWIELDVQENGDNVIVVAHDSDFMKVARNSLKVWEATNDDLRDLDIGSWFGTEFSDQRTPTLHQALQLAKGKLGVVIELKYYGHDRNLESRVVDVVEQTGMTSDIMIMSLKLEGLLKVADLRPKWPRGLLNTVTIGDLTRLDMNFLALNSMAATRAMIRLAHKRGMKVYVWTLNDPIQMSVMMSRGADGIITDKPGLVRQVIGFRDKLSPVGRLLVWIAGETGLLRGVDESSPVEDA